MKLNRLEKAAMNNPVRAFIQRHYEANLLLRMGGACPGASALEIGCGRGVGAEIILDRFQAAHVDAFDFDPEMIAIARSRLARYPEHSVRLFVGDASNIAAPDATYDAVFDFGIIHHVFDWRRAVSEVRRVLKPGGRFYFEEVTRHALERWSARTLTQHPQEDRFSGEEFVAQLEREGIVVGDRFRHRLLGDFVLGVGTLAANAALAPVHSAG